MEGLRRGPTGQRLANAYIACWEASRARDRGALCRRVHHSQHREGPEGPECAPAGRAARRHPEQDDHLSLLLQLGQRACVPAPWTCAWWRGVKHGHPQGEAVPRWPPPHGPPHSPTTQPELTPRALYKGICERHAGEALRRRSGQAQVATSQPAGARIKDGLEVVGQLALPLPLLPCHTGWWWYRRWYISSRKR